MAPAHELCESRVRESIGSVSKKTVMESSAHTDLSQWLLWSVASDGDALREGEREAFEARMRAAWPGVVRLVERLLAWPGSSAEVEDIAQEAFFAAWRARDDFRGESAWTTWVHSIAVRRARNAARSRERRQRWFGLLRSESEFDSLDAPSDAEGAGVEIAVAEDVREALKRLRHADREVLVLRYLEGLPIEEVAARLELGRAAIDTRLSRARSRLKRFLGDFDRTGAVQ